MDARGHFLGLWWPVTVRAMDQSAENDAPQFLNVRESARRLDVHENTIRNWVADGTLTDARVPGSSFTRLYRAEVDRLAAARHGEAVESAEQVARQAIADLRATVASAEAFLATCPIPPDKG